MTHQRTTPAHHATGPLLPGDFPIVLATANAHKVQEMQAILGPRLPIISLAQAAAIRALTGFAEPHESGTTFEQNAIIKAEAYALATGKVCLADDSGIEIDALGTSNATSPAPRPGVISSHYCTDGRETGMTRQQRDSANNARVLSELADLPWPQRTARFVCVMCLVRPVPVRDGTTTLQRLALVRATFEGRIGFAANFPLTSAADATRDHTVPRGPHGFGYDPLFLVAPAFTHTSAELTPADKNATSHRAHAAQLLMASLGIVN